MDTRIIEAIRAAAAELPPEARALYDFYLALLPTLAARKAALPPPPPAAEAAARRAAGSAALRWEDLGVAAEGFEEWIEEVAARFEAQDPGVRDELEVVEPDEWLPLARHWFERGESGAGPTIDALLGNALAPYLERAAEALPPLRDGAWPQATCPSCGGYPNFALFDDRRRQRTLLCERCATRWRARARGCLFCGERAHERFGYYSSEDDLYRVESCDGCGFYLKGMDAAVAKALGVEPLPEAERILTPGLDLTALELGYTRPSALPAAD